MPLPQGLLNSMSNRKVAFNTLVTHQGAGTQDVINIQGTSCFITNYNDPSVARKRTSIIDGVTKLKQDGYVLPPSLKFHLSSRLEGFSKAPTEAICRDQNGNYDGTIYLGVNAIYSKQALVDGLKEGVEHKLRDASTGAHYTKAVVIHEIGHALHDFEQPEYFWGDADLPLTREQLEFAHRWISPYASVNRKEVVAEVFVGHVMGFIFRKPKQTLELYNLFKGPTLHGRFGAHN